MAHPLKWVVGVDLVLEGPYDANVLYSLKFGFKVSNNNAEYEALIARLKLVKDMSTERVQGLSYSMLIMQ